MISIFIFPAESVAWEEMGGLGGLTRFGLRGAFCGFTSLPFHESSPAGAPAPHELWGLDDFGKKTIIGESGRPSSAFGSHSCSGFDAGSFVR
jgi:hypothetical protein